MVKKREIVLVSGGPQQLLSLFALMQQLRKTGDILGIVSYVSGDQRVVAFEKKICQCFGVKYIGSIIELTSKIKEYGFGDCVNSLDTILKRKLESKVKQWFVDIGLWDILNQTSIAMAFRPLMVSDNLLLNILKPKEVFFVPDGFDIATDRNIKKRFSSYLLGIPPYIKKETNCKFYSPEYLDLAIPDHCEKSILKKTAIEDIYAKVSFFLGQSIQDSLGCGCQSYTTIILWNNLYPKFMDDKFLWIEMLNKILALELKSSNGSIVVKPHPRSSNGEIEELIGGIQPSFIDRITVIKDDFLVACPVEVLQEVLLVKKISGVYSTALLSFSEKHDIDVTIYSHEKLPRKLRLEIKRCAKSMGFEPVLL